MYIPNYFKNQNLEEVRAFIQENSFGILISRVANRPWGTHIPLELETDENGQEVIYGHIAKGNLQLKSFEKEEEVLLIYNGPNAYVSSSWYTHENVPTWNYIAVHVYGTLKVISEKELLYSLNKLVDKYEANSENPVRVETMSEKTMRQVKGIVGFRIEISEIQAAFKLSQNRNETDYHRIVDRLKTSKHPLEKETAEIMKKRKSSLI